MRGAAALDLCHERLEFGVEFIGVGVSDGGAVDGVGIGGGV